MNTSEQSLARLVAEATALQRQGRLGEAEKLFQVVLRDDSANFEALQRLGSIRTEEGRHGEAVEYLQRALDHNPDGANAHYNLGISLAALGRPEEAIASYRKAIAIDPDFVEAHTNLGNLQDAARLTDAAVASYRQALAIKPDMTEANHNLARTLLRSGRRAEAVEVYRRWVGLAPDDDEVRYFYAIFSGKAVVARMPDKYVERHFDRFAATFDNHLNQLGYRAPQLVADALARASGPPRGRLEMLDAGCGTGLCGPLIKPHAHRLTGVDLSSGMLKAARARGCYDELVKAELTTYLGGQADAFNAIVSADVLIYFGPLDGVLGAAHRALRPWGLLVFNVERALDYRAADGYRLNPHLRYGHTLSYLRRALAAAGFGVLAIEAASLRTEAGQPVAGFVVTCEKVARTGVSARARIQAHALRMWIRGAISRWRRRKA